MFTIQVKATIGLGIPPYIGIIYSKPTPPNNGFHGHPQRDMINRALDAGSGVLYLHGAKFVSVDHKPIPMQYVIMASNGHTNCLLVRAGLEVSDFLLDVAD